MKRRLLAWLLVGAMVLSNSAFTVLAEDVSFDEAVETVEEVVDEGVYYSDEGVASESVDESIASEITEDYVDEGMPSEIVADYVDESVSSREFDS